MGVEKVHKISIVSLGSECFSIYTFGTRFPVRSQIRLCLGFLCNGIGLHNLLCYAAYNNYAKVGGRHQNKCA